MDPSTANIVAGVLVALPVLGIVAFAAKIILGIRAAGRRNVAFLATAIVAKELTPGAEIAATFAPVAGEAHAIWLDLSLTGAAERVAFEVWLSLRLGSSTLVEESFTVIFDDEGDLRGMHPSAGGRALNTKSLSMPGRETTSTVLCAYRFDAPSTIGAGAGAAEVRARLVPAEGVTLKRARLLVTVKDSPPLG